ncbi:gluconate 2-dehydrogenase subunit 3 family protein [Flectobacillus longus]|uniref:gluconate 2-dehydrogenase subunit 3 family protein n=1 Tax=Flectobacillus longus TaxID=2984207 RepID=UPI0024B6984C|nr:gluconate 2-dehydrogenase subunit 3 family protein [Flectobacillus longus]MDI9880279.1 gluconate 2-dehydrogenase subunit 3 family protein [Flectobacillus longus]
MNRRDVIKNVALMLGGAFSAPTLMAMNHWESPTKSYPSVATFNLTQTQRNIVAEIAELILPKTTAPNDASPGAKDVGVPAFIEMMMKDCYLQPEQMSFIEGLEKMEQVKFLELNDNERKGILKYLEQETKAEMKARQMKQTKMGDNDDHEDIKKVAKGLPFWRLIKELTLLGYFTSEEGIKASFEYVQIPGKVENIKLKPNQKSYAY